jgi:hypothetical protein
VVLVVVAFIIVEKARARGKEVRRCRCYERQELLTGEMWLLKARTVEQSATYAQGAHARTHMHGRTTQSSPAASSILLINVHYCANAERPAPQAGTRSFSF